MKATASWCSRNSKKIRVMFIVEAGEIAGAETPLQVAAQLRRLLEASRTVTVVRPQTTPARAFETKGAT